MEKSGWKPKGSYTMQFIGSMLRGMSENSVRFSLTEKVGLG